MRAARAPSGGSAGRPRRAQGRPLTLLGPGCMLSKWAHQVVHPCKIYKTKMCCTLL